jgi:hypothetical protein
VLLFLSGAQLHRPEATPLFPCSSYIGRPLWEEPKSKIREPNSHWNLVLGNLVLPKGLTAKWRTIEANSVPFK